MDSFNFKYTLNKIKSICFRKVDSIFVKQNSRAIKKGSSQKVTKFSSGLTKHGQQKLVAKKDTS